MRTLTRLEILNLSFNKLPGLSLDFGKSSYTALFECIANNKSLHELFIEEDVQFFRGSVTNVPEHVIKLYSFLSPLVQPPT